MATTDWPAAVLVRPRTTLVGEPSSRDALEVKGPGFRIILRNLGDAVRSALMGLTTGEQRLADLRQRSGSEFSRIDREIGRFWARGLVDLVVVQDGVDLATLRATSKLACLDLSGLVMASEVRLSRFAHLVRVDCDLVVESTVGYSELVAHDPAVHRLTARLFSGLRRRTVVELAGDASPEVSPASVDALVRLMAGAQMLTEMSADQPAEDSDERLQMLSLPDMLLHMKSRAGLSPGPVGATFRFAGVLPPRPALRSQNRDWVETPLPPAHLSHLPRVTLADVIAARRSTRKFGDSEISSEQLSLFLASVFAVSSLITTRPDYPEDYEGSYRLHPSGGAIADLEVFVTAWRVTGLTQAVYHYQPAHQRLARVVTKSRAAERTVAAAAAAAGGISTWPAVVITLVTRFQRLAWKYEGMAYATTLKNVGVLYEAMYLVATAMGLGACALGLGDSTILSEATGSDPLVESAVGEFMLGVVDPDGGEAR